MKLLVAAVLFGSFLPSQAQVATELRLTAPGSALYASVEGIETKIVNSALKAWRIGEGRQVVYSAIDGAGGYENEGQALYLYDVATGVQRKVVAEYFVIVEVAEAKAASGKVALLLTMTNGGLGATHIAVVDPERGEVYTADGAMILNHANHGIVVGRYRDRDWDKLRAKVRVPPFRTEHYDLDALLRRLPIANAASK